MKLTRSAQSEILPPRLRGQEDSEGPGMTPSKGVLQHPGRRPGSRAALAPKAVLRLDTSQKILSEKAVNFQGIIQYNEVTLNRALRQGRARGCRRGDPTQRHKAGDLLRNFGRKGIVPFPLRTLPGLAARSWEEAPRRPARGPRKPGVRRNAVVSGGFQSSGFRLLLARGRQSAPFLAPPPSQEKPCASK